MGRTGGKFLYCVPSDCKSDGTQGIPVLHFQGCLSNPQGATDGWQTDNRWMANRQPCFTNDFSIVDNGICIERLYDFPSNQKPFAKLLFHRNLLV